MLPAKPEPPSLPALRALPPSIQGLCAEVADTARRMQVLFLEGENSLQDRKKKFGNLESCASCLNLWLPPGGNRPAQGNSQAPLHSTFSLSAQRRLSHHLRRISLWFLAVVFCPGVETGPWQRFPGVAEKAKHIWLAPFGASGGGRWRGNENVLPHRNIYKGCFELTAEGRAECQMHARFGSGSTHVPEELERSRCAWSKRRGQLESCAGACKPGSVFVRSRALTSRTAWTESCSHSPVTLV